jgi:hypothetical protein
MPKRFLLLRKHLGKLPPVKKLLSKPSSLKQKLLIKKLLLQSRMQVLVNQLRLKLLPSKLNSLQPFTPREELH